MYPVKFTVSNEGDCRVINLEAYNNEDWRFFRPFTLERHMVFFLTQTSCQSVKDDLDKMTNSVSENKKKDVFDWRKSFLC